MFTKLLLVATLLAFGEAAVLVRFINTVPTRFSMPSTQLGNLDTNTNGVLAASSAGTIVYTGVAAIKSAANSVLTPGTRLYGLGKGATFYQYQTFIDRVGLYYYPETSGAVSSPTVVWTQIVESTEVSSTNNAPFAWYHAMPPLRAFHQVRVGATETNVADQPLGYLTADANWGGAAGFSIVDNDAYDQSRLKADGVGLYLSFAPGKYSFQAYGAMYSTTAALTESSAARALTGTATTFTFEDNKVYTIIAYGSAGFSATVPFSSQNVKLAIITESVAPTSFGKAALRFFHSIYTEAANPIDIYQGPNIGTTKVASKIAFGTVSDYVEVDPNTNIEFPVAVDGSPIRPVATQTPVTRDVRAGSRATVICAQNDEAVYATFCRAIPSRVVAYVRLVADTLSVTSLVQGRFGSQRLSETSLSLWASYEAPYPDQATEIAQSVGSSVFTNHPATSEGLYPVVKNVVPGTASGYGEVFVPVFIMDFAVRFVIGNTAGEFSTAASIPSVFPTGRAFFWFAPSWQRVHFMVKTDGMATLTCNNRVLRNPYPYVGQTQTGKHNQPAAADNDFGGVATTTQDLTTQNVFIEEFVRPGEYYTIFVFNTNTVDTAAATDNYAATLGTALPYQDAAVVRATFRSDRSLTRVSSGTTAGRGVVSLVPFYRDGATTYNDGAAARLQVYAGTFTLAQAQNQLTTTIANTGNGANYAYALLRQGTGVIPTGALVYQQLAAAPSVNLYGDNAEITVVAGTYSWSYSSTAAGTCVNTIPGTGSITVDSGKAYDIMVFNTHACLISTTQNTQLLTTKIVTRESATASGHSPWAAASTRSAEVVDDVSIPLYNSASSSAASLLLALFAAVLAVFAL